MFWGKVLGFIPTNNLQQLVGMLALFGMTAQPTDGGLLELQTGATPVYIKEGQGLGFLFQIIKKRWQMYPQIQCRSLVGWKKSTMSPVKGNVDAVPPVFMQLAMSQVQAGLQASTAQPLP